MKHVFTVYSLTFALVLTSINLVGQSSRFPIAFRTQLSDIVVEGKVVSTEGFLDEEGNVIYTSNIIKVGKVFKGSIQGSEIEIITLGGKVGQKVGIVSHGHTFETGTEGVFFCRDASNTKYPSLAQTPNPHYTITGIEGGFIAFLHDDANPKAVDKFAAYNNISKDVYEKIILTAREPIKILTDGSLILPSFNSPDSPNDQVAISYTFENVYLSSDLSKVTFDVYAKCSQNGIRFGKSKIYVQYNSEVFGNSAATSGILTLEKGTIIQNSAYTIVATNQASEKLEIDISSNFSSLSDSYILTTIPEQLFHVELEIQDFGALANIGFDAFQMSGQSWYYEPSTDRYVLFDRVEVENPIDGAISENAVGITFNIENATVTGSDPKYLEFDVMVKADAPNTKLALAHYILEYNLDAFGLNINSAGNVTITHGDLVATYDYSMVDVVDSDDGGNNLGVTYSYAGLELNTLPTTPTLLSHLKIEIQDCEEKANIEFDSLNMVSQNPNAYYDTILFQYLFYTPLMVKDKYDQYLCSEDQPIIFDFFPDTIPAGIGDSITIVGKNFGESGTLSFTSVHSQDEGMEIFVEAFEEDSIFWSDTLIRYLVTSDLKKNTGQKTPAASGRIKIVAENNMTVISDDTLNVPYAVINYREDIPGAIAERIGMIDGNNLGGYSFYIDSEFDSLGAVECIRDAICSWNNATSANWMFSGIENYSGISTNQRNQIIWSSENSTAAGVTYTAVNLETCDNFLFTRDVDMIVYNPFYAFVMMGDTLDHGGNFNCNIPPTDLESDIQSIILHELGHVHFLDHVASKNKVMYPSLSSGSERPILHPDDINGGLDVVEYSVNYWPSGCDFPKMNPANNCTNATDDKFYTLPKLVIFPNPTSGIIDISFDGIFGDEIAVVEIINSVGILISRWTISIKDLPTTINLDSGVPPGTYIVRVMGNDFHLTGRVIKI